MTDQEQPIEAQPQQDQAGEDAARAAADSPADKAVMTVDAAGFVKQTNHAEVWRTCQLWALSEMIPKSFTIGSNKEVLPMNIVVGRVYYAHQSLCSVQANPLTNLRFVAWIEGNPMFWGDLPLSLVQASKMLAEDPEEYWLDEHYQRICIDNKNITAKPFAAVSRMRTKGSRKWHEYTYTVDEAIDMGKLPTNYRDWLKNPKIAVNGVRDSDRWKRSVWAAHCKRMLQMRARSWLIKDKYPHCTKGNRILEYDAIGDVDASVISDQKQQAALPQASDRLDLNQIYGGEQKETVIVEHVNG